MQGKGPEYIPTKSGKRGEKLRKIGYDESTHYMNTASFFIRKRINNKAKTSLELELFPIDILQKMHWREIANTILTDPNLSQSYGNPEYYLPVPEYAQPELRRLSVQEIQLAHSSAHKHAKGVSENFGDTCVWVSNTPITLGDWELYNMASFPYVSSGNFYTCLQSLKTIQGYTQQELYSYPKIVERIKWFVTFCCSDKGNEILGMYCYQNKSALEELTEFLAETPTTNEDDKNDAILRLSQIYYQIS